MFKLNKGSKRPALGLSKGPALSKANGFTLVELMVVVAILAVLMAVVMPAVSGTKSVSLVGQVKSDGKSVQTAVDNSSQKSIKAGGFPEATPTETGHSPPSGDAVLTPGYVARFQIDTDSTTTPAAALSTFNDAAVLLLPLGVTGTANAKPLSTMIPIPGKKDANGAQNYIAQWRFLDLTKETNIYDSSGAVKTVKFVPDYLSKAPESIPMKGDETKDLGVVLNQFPEFLWLLQVNSPGSDQETRTVQVYRMTQANCGATLKAEPTCKDNSTDRAQQVLYEQIL